MKVIDASAKFVVSGMYPKVFLQTIDAPTQYHEDMEDNFYIVRDNERFALGITWFCGHCHTEVYQHEEWASNSKMFILTELKCRNCGNYFLREGTEPELASLKFLWEIHTGCWRDA